MNDRITESISDEVSRLDIYIAERCDITRSRAEGLIEKGNVTVDDIVRTKSGYRLAPGMRVIVRIPAPAPTGLHPEAIPVRIVYEDDDVAVVFKPSGMVVHPACGNESGTLVNALLYCLDGLSGIGGEIRPGIVHRIDKDTSGLLLIAKNDIAHNSLSEQIKAHAVHRAYKAIVIGTMKESSGSIEAAIGRHPTDRKRMAIVENGRYARTDWFVLEELRGAALIEARLTTGRTHQIRVHMSSIGHPVLGDPVYGPKRPPFRVDGGQLLHAYRIGFKHPVSGREMIFEAEPEERFIHWLKKLR